MAVRKQLLLDIYVQEYNNLLEEYPHLLVSGSGKAKGEFHLRLQKMREKFSAETN